MGRRGGGARTSTKTASKPAASTSSSTPAPARTAQPAAAPAAAPGQQPVVVNQGPGFLSQVASTVRLDLISRNSSSCEFITSSASPLPVVPCRSPLICYMYRLLVSRLATLLLTSSSTVVLKLRLPLLVPLPVRLLFFSLSSVVNAPVGNAAQESLGPCMIPQRTFNQCLAANNNSISLCQWAFDQMQTCLRDPKAFQNTLQ